MNTVTDNYVVRGSKNWAAFGRLVADLSKELAWYTRRTYVGHSIRSRVGGWLLVINADFKGRRQVAFFDGDTELDCWRSMYKHMHAGSMGFRDSKF